MFCAACGQKLEEGVRFCSACGKATANVSAPIPIRTAQPSDHPAANAAPAHLHSTHILEGLEERLTRLAGTEKLEGFSFSDMFSEVFKRRGPEELDEYFISGTALTTPPLDRVQTGWPKPWFFFRVLIFVVALYLGFDYLITAFGNPNAIPGLLVMGSLAIPLTILVMFFELNTPRNVAFVRVLSLFCVGAIVGFVFTEFVDEAARTWLAWMGHSLAGIVEEVAKLLAVCVIVRQSRHKYILNGLLFGAAVGAGFAVFESMGYAFNAFRNQFLHSTIGMINDGARSFQDIMAGAFPDALRALTGEMQSRAWLSPFGHVAWTAIAAAGLWRVKGDRDLEIKMLFDSRFLRAMVIPVALHMIWDLQEWTQLLGWLGYLVYLALGAVGWFVVLGLVQQGLHQVRNDQIEHAKNLLQEAKATPITTGQVAAAPGVS